MTAPVRKSRGGRSFAATAHIINGDRKPTSGWIGQQRLSESYFERFRRMMDEMDFETLPLFSKPYFSWSLHTDYVGRRFQYRPYTESTQDDARHMLQRWRSPNGTIILAETQSAGRGRAGRTWVSPAGRQPLLHPRPLPRRGPAAAGLRHAARHRRGDRGRRRAPRAASCGSLLKWPNDVFISGKKVAGELIETTETEEGETGRAGRRRHQRQPRPRRPPRDRRHRHQHQGRAGLRGAARRGCSPPSATTSRRSTKAARQQRAVQGLEVAPDHARR